MRKRARVLLIGEVTGVGRSKVQAYFELRDAEGAVPCAIWLNDLERAGACRRAALRDGAEVVIAGGPDYYPGGGAGVAELLLSAPPTCAWRAKGICSPAWRRCASSCAPRDCSSCKSSCRGRCCRRRSAWSPRNPAPPAVICWQRLARRGWAGTVVWAFAPVQDRHAAPAIARGDPGIGGAP